MAPWETSLKKSRVDCLVWIFVDYPWRWKSTDESRKPVLSFSETFHPKHDHPISLSGSSPNTRIPDRAASKHRGHRGECFRGHTDSVLSLPVSMSHWILMSDPSQGAVGEQRSEKTGRQVASTFRSSRSTSNPTAKERTRNRSGRIFER